jgi:hypothetical protein
VKVLGTAGMDDVENGHKRTPYEEMRVLQDQLNEGVRRGERWTLEGERGLLAMARSNDPFYAGQGWQLEQAEWFADLFRRLGFEGRRVHVRFVHYVACGEEPNPATGEKQQERLPDSSPYENTEKNWQFIQAASKHARNMGKVDPRSIVDRRTPRPFLNAPEEPPSAPGVEVHEPSIRLPSIEVNDLEPYRSGGRAYPTGYEYSVAFEPSLVEMWMEKSLDDADDPLIETLCEEEGVNLITGIGFMTISSVYALLERRAHLEKSLRILYLSDFDPAGKHMPGAPARHVEFALRNMEGKPDIRLHHLALTEDQVKELELPRIPIKDSDRRKARFEAKHGEGATELNALMLETRRSDTEAMLRGAIRELRDGELPRKLLDARMEAQAILEEEMARRLRWPRRALELIEEEAQEVGERYAEELQDLADRLAEEIGPLEERANRVLRAASRRLAGLEEEVILPEVKGEEPEESAHSWLFDSRRDYFEQLRYYKER